MIKKKVFAVLMSIMLIVGMMPAYVFAESFAASENPVGSSMDMKATSNTNNMVGQLFADYFTDSYNNQKTGKKSAKYDFDAYPWEHHKRSYYGDSLRVRDLSDGKYLVYRDSLLLVSKADSTNYSVRYSKDERTAYVKPAFSEKELKGKTGIVFLADSVGDDEILAFDGKPHREGNPPPKVPYSNFCR